MIITIGLWNDQDRAMLRRAALWLEDAGYLDLATKLIVGPYDEYDMTNLPHKGDAIHAITREVELVIAFHLNGIDRMPGGRGDCWDPTYFYTGDNYNILPKCMALNIPLVCFGDQPWFGVTGKDMINSRLYIYREKTDKDCLGG